MSGTLRDAVVARVRAVQRMPYAWPAPPDADSARELGEGSCASKHALLAEELFVIGVPSAPLLVVGPLVPLLLRGEPDCAAGLALVEVHECLTVITPWDGPLRVDVTWDPPLIARGLAGDPAWSGDTDMPLAVGDGSPGWAASHDGVRAAKLALRARLYTRSEREARDATLAAMSRHFAAWRASAEPT